MNRIALLLAALMLSSTALAEEAAVDHRPADPWSLGIGAGWRIPTDLFVPNTASVRFLFPGALTLEPFINGSFSQAASQTLVEQPEADDVDDKSTVNGYQVAVGATARVPVFRRGNLDLQVLVTGAVAHSQTFPDADADEENSNDATNLSLGYGVGIEWFVARNISLTVDAQNPLASWTRSSSKFVTPTQFVDPDTGEITDGERTTTSNQSNLLIGAIFSPSVQAMVHLYF